MNGDPSGPLGATLSLLVICGNNVAATLHEDARQPPRMGATTGWGSQRVAYLGEAFKLLNRSWALVSAAMFTSPSSPNARAFRIYDAPPGCGQEAAREFTHVRELAEKLPPAPADVPGGEGAGVAATPPPATSQARAHLVSAIRLLHEQIAAKLAEDPSRCLGHHIMSEKLFNSLGEFDKHFPESAPKSAAA